MDAILKFGAEELFKEGEGDDKQDRQLEEMNIDDILQRAETHEAKAGGAGEALLQQFKTVHIAAMEEDAPAKSWDEILPATEIERAQQIAREAADRETAAALVVEPRVRKQVELYAGGDAGEDDEGDAAPRAAKKSKGSGGGGGGSGGGGGGSGKDKEGAMTEYGLSLATVKAVVSAVRRFGNINTHMDAILATVGDGCLAADVTQLATKLEVEAERAIAEGKTSFEFAGLTLGANDLLRRKDDMWVIAKYVNMDPRYRLPFVLKAPQWSIEWGPHDDVHLLQGIRRHGFGQWEKMKADATLALGHILPDEKGTRPQRSHLGTRVDQLTKQLRLVRMNGERGCFHLLMFDGVCFGSCAVCACTGRK